MIPTLNSAPKYEVEIPSMSKTVRFRPYTVKEEKVLLSAGQDSEEAYHMLRAIADTIQACIVDDIDVNNFTVYDINYVFSNIRSKSAGELVDLKIKCSECKAQNEVAVDIDIQTVENKPYSTEIDLGEGFAIEMNYLKFGAMLQDKILMEGNHGDPETRVQLVAASIVTIKTPDERFVSADSPMEEITAFVDSMNPSQFNLAWQFVGSPPKLLYEFKFDCISCGHHNAETLGKQQDFF